MHLGLLGLVLDQALTPCKEQGQKQRNSRCFATRLMPYKCKALLRPLAGGEPHVSSARVRQAMPPSRLCAQVCFTHKAGVHHALQHDTGPERGEDSRCLGMELSFLGLALR